MLTAELKCLTSQLLLYAGVWMIGGTHLRNLDRGIDLHESLFSHYGRLALSEKSRHYPFDGAWTG
jgi:hypothetical protein